MSRASEKEKQHPLGHRAATPGTVPSVWAPLPLCSRGDQNTSLVLAQIKFLVTLGAVSFP